LKRVILLGATGSIGTSACDVVRTHTADLKLVAVAARSSRAAVETLGREFGARVYCGEEAAVRAVEENEADLVLVATVGLSGLAPTLAALAKGCDVALATKEVLVAAGAFVTAQARAAGARLIPVDSEHSAIYQCLPPPPPRGAALESPCGAPNRGIDRLVLTASGGPFLDGPADLASVTPAQALDHPRWKMGPKVTVDSSTMMNKGFEILEARWLFDVPVDRIDVVIHPESIVHSLVTFSDGATLAQLSPPDMRVPIQYALLGPDRVTSSRAALDLPALGRLTFRAPDPVRFPCLALAAEACRLGGTKTAVLSAADEVAVARFLAGEIRYTDIPRLLAAALAEVRDIPCDSLAHVYEADRLARSFAQSFTRFSHEV